MPRSFSARACKYRSPAALACAATSCSRESATLQCAEPHLELSRPVQRFRSWSGAVGPNWRAASSARCASASWFFATSSRASRYFCCARSGSKRGIGREWRRHERHDFRRLALEQQDLAAKQTQPPRGFGIGCAFARARSTSARASTSSPRRIGRPRGAERWIRLRAAGRWRRRSSPRAPGR